MWCVSSLVGLSILTRWGLRRFFGLDLPIRTIVICAGSAAVMTLILPKYTYQWGWGGTILLFLIAASLISYGLSHGLARNIPAPAPTEHSPKQELPRQSPEPPLADSKVEQEQPLVLNRVIQFVPDLPSQGPLLLDYKPKPANYAPLVLWQDKPVWPHRVTRPPIRWSYASKLLRQGMTQPKPLALLPLQTTRDRPGSLGPCFPIYPNAENLDALLEYAFACKEQLWFYQALGAFCEIYGFNPGSDAAPFILMEISSLYLHLGKVDEACFYLTEGILWAQQNRDGSLETEFQQILHQVKPL